MTSRRHAILRGFFHGTISVGLFSLLVSVLSIGNSSPAHAVAEQGPCGRPYEAVVQYPYAIDATWMFARDTGCYWQQDLEAFHRIGGKAVLQFGSTLERLEKTASGLVRADDSSPVLSGCQHPSGASCAEQAESDLAALGIPSTHIANWLLYTSFEPHGTGIACPGTNSLTRRIDYEQDGASHTVWRVVLPHEDAADACDYRAGQVDVLFVEQQPAARAQESLMQVAQALDMEVYLGAPAFPTEAGAAWKPDYTLAPAILDWSRRVFSDLADRYADYPSFRGVYQTFEVPLMPAWQGDGYDLYSRQAQLLHEADPDARYVVSPYLYVNKSQGGTDVAGTVTGFERLARGGVDVIVPQDGRGTGKTVLFWAWEKEQNVSNVDPQLGNYTNVDADASFEAQFNASSKQLFTALRTAAAELQQNDGIAVQLWPNIEAFDEDRDDPDYVGCAYSDLSQTTKSRVDRAITFAGPAQRVASFMFDPLFNCSDRYGTTLLANIMADYDRPIVTEADFTGEHDADLVVRGYHLISEGTRFEVEWYDGSTPRRSAGTVITRTERGEPRSPDTVWLQFDGEPIPHGSRLSVNAMTEDGRRAYEAFSLATDWPVLASAN